MKLNKEEQLLFILASGFKLVKVKIFSYENNIPPQDKYFLVESMNHLDAFVFTHSDKNGIEIGRIEKNHLVKDLPRVLELMYKFDNLVEQIDAAMPMQMYGKERNCLIELKTLNANLYELSKGILQIEKRRDTDSFISNTLNDYGFSTINQLREFFNFKCGQK